ncbi:UvrD-helicase domain-containing protein [Agrobacterium vitis]|uniref:UvrD-helicase domain-containing protein n=1 Tax=Agrobacterium vitis TaxID=373 RepID=UPI0009BD2911|nr:UvrD-helicase domain-containing protein [Agrobacterium vitis]MCE6073843.1 AAA family ATPase [Agrobacterium vitis]MCM2468672.1 UvrD-helicase domain-containing protein [Agrobacterium vitis]MUO71613.1 AAA family ATPase [Agrobacterium vitis]MUO85732.1 AAA family ATPase [Agrobacterium vitis]
MTVIRRIQSGTSLIRGAAGSGKTSTALTALRAATGTVVNQLRNEGTLPAHVLVLTFYNSLKGYIAAVVSEEMADYAESALLYVLTFDKWAFDTLGITGPIEVKSCENELRRLAQRLPRDINFVLDEVNYLLGRFPPANLDDYIVRARTGRGNSPQMDTGMRTRLLNEVVRPYIQWKQTNNIRDFHDIAVQMSQHNPTFLFDVVVVDEAQDFSANQLRAIMRHCAPDATITIVTDTAQRIYPRGTSWAEAGVTISAPRSFRLNVNYRNTKEIAELASAVAAGLPMDDDASVPDPKTCEESGKLPVLLKGLYSDQVKWSLDYLAAIDLKNETVGFLHLKAGHYFDYLRKELQAKGMAFCELQGSREWPEGEANIGLCTFHSAKGLEFDHLFLIGLAQKDALYGNEPDDDRFEALRRLVAMGIGRARKTVVLGAKPSEALLLLNDIDESLIEVIEL